MRQRIKGPEARKRIMKFLSKNVVKLAPVSFEDIMQATGISSRSVVYYHLAELEEEGKIKRDKNIARHIEVIE